VIFSCTVGYNLKAVLVILYAGSAGARAAKEPGYLEVRTSSTQFTRMHFFPQKVDDFF